ncbi:hypothetical protein [Oharaeibacter diazotrophicus]|uniref:Uncharacterized protein n=1 Tax=Oharaeibacter diazotrophicus TaxID=1920512 RepID=A0A4R6R9C9_9HYPH|nr:hypothetical protein [Oharaeibacter diazotrophicus]TDP82445.1 hypothetical protein EDD54_3712 [Oharaeibacter diazotrophicus]BBE72792.1 hypothetical protein OHA_1_02391 [Pleomorphomonas sp. SM30]GLS76830.1 hypothetical protein GCM10007904_21670 [Oharaeibacter diazotrophicus]
MTAARALAHAFTALTAPAWGNADLSSETRRTAGFYRAANFLPFVRVVADAPRLGALAA